MSENMNVMTAMSMRPDLRHRRAVELTAYIMSIVGKYICDHTGEQLHRRVHDDLMKSFYETGAEIITDLQRAAMGLPKRDEAGWTPFEAQAMEALRMQAMVKPLSIEPIRSVEGGTAGPVQPK